MAFRGDNGGSELALIMIWMWQDEQEHPRSRGKLTFTQQRGRRAPPAPWETKMCPLWMCPLLSGESGLGRWCVNEVISNIEIVML